MAILEQAQHARNNPYDVKFFPDGTMAWPEVLRPWLELRGNAAAEPPSIDIGADVPKLADWFDKYLAKK